MKLKLFRKETWLKKSTWIITVVFLVAILGVIIPIFNTKASDDIKMEILEIQPANQFELNSTDNNIKITHMSMMQFIGSIDELNGKYDAIYIGRKNDGLNSNFEVNKVYRDYSAPLTQKFTSKLWYMQSDFDGYNNLKSWDNKTNGTSEYNKTLLNPEAKSKTFTEYVSENDITNKKATEIINFAKTGQKVYIDSSALIDGTKLKSNFSPEQENITKVNHGSISLNNIINNYKELKESDGEREEINLTTKPGTDSKDDVKGDPENRTMEFEFSLENADNYKVNLYLDYDGDGLFKDTEKAELEDGDILSKYKVKNESNKYLVSYNLGNGYVGWLGYKLEIVKDNNVKSTYVGNSIYKNIKGEKLPVRVLQVYPAVAAKPVLKLTESENFKNAIQAASDYNITIEAVDTNTFNSKDVAQTCESYDMIIVGFSDGYGLKGSDITGNGLEIIKKFDDDGKSIMFTHDVFGLNSFGDSNWNSQTGPQTLGHMFRDVVGQSRYVDPFSINPKSSTIVHDYFDLNNSSTMGQTFYNAYGHDNEFTCPATEQNMYRRTLKTKVTQVNSAQITNYPYDLNNKEFIKVSQTHTQWYQLNLEDPDVVPWYNLYDDPDKTNIDSMDSRNFYYTYSKGNITYSGTGHEGTDIPESEAELFVNTIVKAIILPSKTTFDSSVKDGEVIEVEAGTDAFKVETKIENTLMNFSKYKLTYNKKDGTEVTDSKNNVKSEETVTSYIDLTGYKAGDEVNVSINIKGYEGIKKDQEIGTINFKIKIVAQASVKHGMRILDYGINDRGLETYTDSEKDAAISTWLKDSTFDITKIDVATNNVSYYARVPFEAIVKVNADSEKIKIKLDDKFQTKSENGISNIKIYSLSEDNKLSSEPIGEIATELGKLEYEYTIDKSKLFKDELGLYDIVVKYTAKTLVQPNDTTTVTAKGIETSTPNGPIEYTNTISVIDKENKEKATKSATVTVGRVILDRPLF
ncbi:MAG: DUF5057 domain-containing protein [Clostridium sp.]|nr:DUF5057 domain-containing protein [Clostridium sp.]